MEIRWQVKGMTRRKVKTRSSYQQLRRNRNGEQKPPDYLADMDVVNSWR
jgi:hypothetical protein